MRAPMTQHFWSRLWEKNKPRARGVELLNQLCSDVEPACFWLPPQKWCWTRLTHTFPNPHTTSWTQGGLKSAFLFEKLSFQAAGHPLCKSVLLLRCLHMAKRWDSWHTCYQADGKNHLSDNPNFRYVRRWEESALALMWYSSPPETGSPLYFALHGYCLL